MKTRVFPAGGVVLWAVASL